MHSDMIHHHSNIDLDWCEQGMETIEVSQSHLRLDASQSYAYGVTQVGEISEHVEKSRSPSGGTDVSPLDTAPHGRPGKTSPHGLARIRQAMRGEESSSPSESLSPPPRRLAERGPWSKSSSPKRSAKAVTQDIATQRAGAAVKPLDERKVKVPDLDLGQRRPVRATGRRIPNIPRGELPPEEVELYEQGMMRQATPPRQRKGSPRQDKMRERRPLSPCLPKHFADLNVSQAS